jgi:hypothetical protein
MDYNRLYENIIKSSLLKNRKKGEDYYENHHIIPKCIGGSDEKQNLVLLTAKEHFVCHLLLCEIYPESSSLKFALWSMCNQLKGDVKREYKISSSTYDRVKRDFSKQNSLLHKGKKMSESSKSKISDFMRSDKNPMKGRTGERNPLYKKERPSEVVKKISETKLKNPEKNAIFKGTYVTPMGNFLTSREAGICNNLDKITVAKRCKSDNFKVITKKSVMVSKDLKEEFIGKTFNDLGWGFISQPRK